MKVLLVDDDPYLLECLEHQVDWAHLQIDSVMTAGNMAEAQRLISRSCPEIMIADIEMPMGSGLELIRWLRQQHYRCEVILLTNHECFEHAKTAFEMDVLRYLTKPMKKQEVEDAVIQAMERYSYTVDYVPMGERMVRRTPFSAERQLLCALFGQEPMAQTENSLLLCFCFHQQQAQTDGSPNAIRARIASKFSSIAVTDIAESSREQLLMFWLLHPPVSQSDEWRKQMVLYVRELSEEFAMPLVCYVAQTDFGRKIGRLSQKIEGTAQIDRTKSGLVFIDSEQSLAPREKKPTLRASDCYQLYRDGDRKGLLLLLNQTLHELQNDRSLDKEAIGRLKAEFLQVSYAYLYDVGIPSHTIWQTPEEQQLLEEAEQTAFDFIRKADFLCARIFELVEKKRSTSSLIEKAKAFIHEHYTEEISRTAIAEDVGFSADYLARVFKAETGMTCNEYLTQYRMEKAKSLLLTKEVSVSDVAQMVGYDHFSYFCTLFKRHTGVSPQQYRKSKRNKAHGDIQP